MADFVLSSFLFVFAAAIGGAAADAEAKCFDVSGRYIGLEMKGNVGCYTFEPDWKNKIVAVDVGDELPCIAFHKEPHCRGAGIFLAPGGHDLYDYEFANQAVSIMPCQEKHKADAKPGKDPKAEVAPEEIQKIAAEEHNRYRKLHGVPEMTADAEMCKDSQEWADTLAKDNKFEATTMGKYGSNVAASFRSNKLDAVRGAIRRWYFGNDVFDCDALGESPESAKYASIEVVWKSTVNLGVGVAWNEATKYWIVNMFYSPPAYMNECKDNLMPKTEELPAQNGGAEA